MASEINAKKIEIDLLLESIYRRYDYDFRGYAKASISRRISVLVDELKLSSISELQHQLLYDPKLFNKVFLTFAIRVTEMFRDPKFFKAIIEHTFPKLSDYSTIKIWHAGCSTGEEVYSMAILLQEHGLLERTQLYATDFNQNDLERGRLGRFQKSNLDLFTQNYIDSGGKASLSKYYKEHHDTIEMDDSLKKRILFANHNLAMDSVFGEMHMIICRNVLIYFSKELQNSVLCLFKDSLVPYGFLGLGSKETTHISEYAPFFNPINDQWKLYQFTPSGVSP